MRVQGKVKLPETGKTSQEGGREKEVGGRDEFQRMAKIA